MTKLLIECANFAGDRWSGWALSAFVDTTALLAFVSVIWLAIRRHVAPQVGYGLFLLVPLKLLLPVSIVVPASIAARTPAAVMSVWFGVTSSESIIDRDATLPLNEFSLRSDSSALAEPLHAPEGQSSVAGRDTEEPNVASGIGWRGTTAATAEAPTPSGGNAPQLSARAVVFVVWLSGTLLLFGRQMRTQLRFRTRLRRLDPFTACRLGVDLRELCRRAGVTRSIRLVESDDLPAPAVWGILRPTIILPKQITSSFTVPQLRWVLLHELAHVRRHDLAVVLLQRVAALLHFFNPAVWIANRVANRLREYACDDLALALSSSSPVETSEAFLQIVGYANNHERGLDGALGVFGLGSRSACFARVRRLLDTDRPLRTKTSPWALGGLLLLAAVALPSLRAANEDPKSESKGGAEALTKSVPSSPDAGEPSEKMFALRIIGPDGKPVPNAELELRTIPIVEAGQVRIGMYVRKGRNGAFAKADTEGRFMIDLPARPSHFEVFIEMPGYGPYWARWSSQGRDAGPPPPRFTAELEAGWTVGGVVVDGEGMPVAGAKVRPRIEFKKRPGDGGQLSSGASVTTDAGGKWRYESVPASLPEVDVEINHSDFRPEHRPLTKAEFGIERRGQPAAHIVLDRGVTVTGKVTDDAGRPIAGALIRTKFGNDLREATTGDDGVYRLGGCEPISTRIVVSAKGRALDMKTVRVDREMEPVDFRMQPGGKLRIRVLDAKNNPLPKASVHFQIWRGRVDYFEFRHVDRYTDENGVWEWNEAPLDEMAADIVPPDGMTLSEQPLLARDEEYVFRTPPVLVITGKVIDAETKKPIEKFQVLPGLRSSETKMNWVESQRFTATDGRFTVRETHGYFAWLVRVEAGGYRSAVSRDIKSDEGDVSLEFELHQGKDDRDKGKEGKAVAKNIVGKIVTPERKPAAGAKIALGGADSQINIKNGEIQPSALCVRQDSDASGRFEYPPQDAEFHLVITHPTGYAYVKSAPDWGEIKIIPLQPWARVEGTFRIGPKAIANVPIDIGVRGGPWFGNEIGTVFAEQEVTTGPGGRFTFERVFPGNGSIGRGIHATVADGTAERVSSHSIPAMFPGGKTTRLLLGGTGRPVIGKLQPPNGFEGRVPWNFGDIMVEPAEQSVDTDDSHYLWATIGPDGTFRIDDVPSGKYTMRMSFTRDRPGKLPEQQFTVPKFEGERMDQPLDLGVLKLDK